jgi:hypothetical protein
MFFSIFILDTLHSKSASRLGSGWRCERGFRESGEACVPVEVPSNRYLDAYGKGWKCERGFVKAGRKLRRRQYSCERTSWFVRQRLELQSTVLQAERCLRHARVKSTNPHSASARERHERS